MADSKLNPRQARFVENFVKGASAAEAARAAGYGKAYAAKAGKYILTQEPVRAAVDAAQGALRKSSQYELEDIVRDINEELAAMRKEKNVPWMSVHKHRDLLARLHGLLIDRLDVRHAIVPDLAGAMLEARQRVHLGLSAGIVQDVDYVMCPPVDPFG